jgi:hypothetical protein
MNRANMAKQITEVPMAGCKSKGHKMGGRVKAGYKKGGKVMAKKGYKMGGKVDQTACSPRKRAAMGLS